MNNSKKITLSLDENTIEVLKQFAKERLGSLSVSAAIRNIANIIKNKDESWKV
jgi:hypothetical protein